MAKAPEREQALAYLSRFVGGDGIELGPGHQPFPLPFSGVRVRYVDRWKPDENAGMFPELGEGVVFPTPDIIADLDDESLSMLPDESEDFVIASHVLEHLCDPIRQLAEIHRVLRPGGVALVMLPDRRMTFDRARQGTTLEHLRADHEAGMRVPDDAHLEEFLIYTEGWNAERDAATRDATFEHHRRRSFHVHCWTQEEFLPVIRHSITEMGASWELIDAMLLEDMPESIEFGFVLRRALHPGKPDELADRLGQVWAAVVESRREREPEPVPVPETSWRDVLNRNPAYRAIRRPLRPVKRIARAALGRRGEHDPGPASET
jgi:SAM-dependent methyltransferase